MTDPSIQKTPSARPEMPLAVEPSVSPSSTTGVPFAATFTTIHAFLWLGLLALLLFYVPTAERLFRDFNMMLPKSTQLALLVAKWVGNYWYVLVIWLVLWLAFDAVLLAILRRRNRGLACMWALFQGAMILLAATLMLLAVELPKMKLLEGLSR